MVHTVQSNTVPRQRHFELEDLYLRADFRAFFLRMMYTEYLFRGSSCIAPLPLPLKKVPYNMQHIN